MTEPEAGATSAGHPHLNREDPEELLDPSRDPGAVAFGASGTEAGTDLSWLALLRHRVERRATGSSRYPWWVLTALLAGLLALNITFTVFIVALPKVAGEFHTSVVALTWTMTGPLLAYGLAAPVLGRVGDLFGHRRLYLFGLAGAMVSAVLTALAGSVGMLLFARTLDGIQGAATGTASMALIMSAFSKEDRVKAMGWWTLVGAGGPVIGVSLGAPIIQAFGWRALFWMQLGLLVVAFMVVALIIPRPGHHRAGLVDHAPAKKVDGWKGMDWIGSWTLSGSVTAVMLGLSFGPSWGWTSALVLGLFVLSAVLLLAFAARIRSTDNPLIPPEYFTRRNFVMPMVVRAAGNFAYFGAFYLFPLLMEQGYGYSIAAVGAIAIARPLLFALASPIAGYTTVRVGERNSSVAGMVFLTGSLAIFSLLQVHSSAAWVVLALALSGLGMGVAMPATSSTMANEVDPSRFGVMGSAQMLAMQVGEVAGIQVLVTLQQAAMHREGLGKHSARAAQLATFRWPFALGAAVAAIGIAASLSIRDLDRSGVNADVAS